LRVGQDWHIASGDDAGSQLGEYLAKSVAVVDSSAVADGLGLELTHGMSGRAREGLATRPVWSLLDDLAETGEIGTWREWESGSKGRRQVGWSNGLRERFAPSMVEESDQAIVDQVLGDETDDLAWWTADEWRVFIDHPTRARELLDVAQLGSRELVHDLLTAWGVRCTLIDRVPSSVPGDSHLGGLSPGHPQQRGTDGAASAAGAGRPPLRGAGGATPRGASVPTGPGS
jgi:hypothetical protein